jgi:thioester reductase-like protein
MKSIFFTGFPGFLGAELLPRVLKRHDKSVKAYCLVQEKFLKLAKTNLDKIEKEYPETKNRIKLEVGDITQSDLGLGRASHIKGSVTEIFHLAAVYDLKVSRALGLHVNVNGTQYMLDFAQKCKKLSRFHYVSTCYVSGRHNGYFGESDLDVGQSFNNFYEETKFFAEMKVRDAMSDGLPATIYRPSIVVGDSITGETQKYDGPYHAIQWMLRLPKTFVFPQFLGANRYRLNLVPKDYVINGIDYLSGLDKSLGQTYQLCDPRPMKIAVLVKMLARAVGRKLYPLPLPLFLAKYAVKNVKVLDDWMKIPPELMDYFTHPTHYSAEKAMVDLKGSGISCTPFPVYVNNMVDFVKKNENISSDAMI